ncbi:sensor histidine kinase [Larkinella sp. GY13]|uniref:sensor histidine kinase n=1 Tax=Larkinella sp. GY13 TaxID=3453720 RepID=UPI003EED0E43
MGHLWYFWLFAWMVLVQAAWAQPAQQPLLVGTSALPSGEFSLRDAIHHFEDTTGRVTIHQAIHLHREGHFKPSESQTYRQDFGYTTTVHWLFFELETVQKADLMLEIEYANIDQVELFEVSNNRIQLLARTGDHYRFSQRPIVNNNYVFPLRLPVSTKAGYYLRFEHSHAILSFFIRLWPRAVFLQVDRDEYFFWGIYIGIVCIICLVTLVMLLATRDWIYLWYALYLHFMTMHLFSDAGLGFQYLWPDLPAINELAPVYLYIWVSMIAQITFLQFFIRQPPQNSRVYPWITAFKVGVMGTLLAVLSIHFAELEGRETYFYQFVASATRYFVIVLVLLTALSLYETVRRSDRDQKAPLVRYYTYALIIEFIGYSSVSFINFCQDQGWALPVDVQTYVIIGITVFLDIIFFSYGLAHRYQTFRQENRILELNLLEAKQIAQQRVINSLEKERQRLAQDLHDEVGATLATAKGYLSRLARDEKTAPVLQAQVLLDQAASELRTISHQLMPKHLNQTGLANAIEEAIRKRSDGWILFEFMSLGQIRPLAPQSEWLILSIATDLIRHAQQHEGTTEVTIQLIYHTDRLSLMVEDNGRSVSLNDRKDSSWQNLNTKAHFLKAELLVDASAQGHTVILSVPIPAS